jgi:hypothetical protein
LTFNFEKVGIPVRGYDKFKKKSYLPIHAFEPQFTMMNLHQERAKIMLYKGDFCSRFFFFTESLHKQPQTKISLITIFIKS